MWARTSAAAVAGFLVAAAATGWIAWFPPGPWQQAVAPSLVAFPGLWMLSAIWAFSVRSGVRAWAWLGGSALVGLGLLWWFRSNGWVQ